MGTAGRLISLQLEQPAVSMASLSGQDSDLGLRAELGRALQEGSAPGLSARSRRQREEKPRSVLELSSELPSDSGTR